MKIISEAKTQQKLMGGMETSRLIMFLVTEGRNTTSPFLFLQVFIFLVSHMFFHLAEVEVMLEEGGQRRGH